MNPLSSWGGEKRALELCFEGTILGLGNGERHFGSQNYEDVVKVSSVGKVSIIRYLVKEMDLGTIFGVYVFFFFKFLCL